MTDDREVVVEDNTWHYRNYEFWRDKLGGKPSPYMENFCRYCRIVALTVPRYRFLHGRIKGVVPPWTIPATVLALAGVSAGFNFWPDLGFDVLIVVGAIVLICVLALGIVIAAEEHPKVMMRVLKYGTSPVWVAPYFGSWPFRKFYKSYKPQIETAFWFSVRLVLALVVAAGIGLTIYLFVTQTGSSTHITLLGLAFAGIAIAICSVAVAIVWACRKLKIRIPLKALFGGIFEGIKLGATYIDTKKQGTMFCPFIKFQNSSQE